MSYRIMYFIGKKSALWLILIGIVSTFTACDGEKLEESKFGFRSMIGFQVLPVNNPADIYIGHVGIIDNEKKTVTISLPAGADLKNIRPEITLAPYATVKPASMEPIDLTGEVEYVVTAQNGRKAYYNVICKKNFLYTGATLMAATFKNILDEQGEPMRFLFNKNKISYTLPVDGDLSSVELFIEPDPYSQNATYYVNNKIIDFSTPIDFSLYPNGIVVMMISENNKNFANYTITLTKKVDLEE